MQAILFLVTMIVTLAPATVMAFGLAGRVN